MELFYKISTQLQYKIQINSNLNSENIKLWRFKVYLKLVYSEKLELDVSFELKQRVPFILGDKIINLFERI